VIKKINGLTPAVDAEQWRLKQPFGKRTLAAVLVVVLLLGWSFKRVDLPTAVSELGNAALYTLGLKEHSQVATGAVKYAQNGWPLVFSQEKPVNRIENFDPSNLPTFSRVEVRTVVEPEYDFELGQMVNHESTAEYLVQPVGYLGRVLRLMFETIEMAFWGTVIAVLVALPLTYLGAKNYTPWVGLYHLSRAFCSFCRAMPELIAAMFLVLMFGFGPIAGMLALGLHTAGLLGKFFADDIENADPGPQMALLSTGASKMKVLRIAVLPQVLPQYIAYVQYILERNVRTATILGIVGAGGIGLELKGRWEMFDYGHVTTILLVIFLTVYGLEQASQVLRKRLIA